MMKKVLVISMGVALTMVSLSTYLTTEVRTMTDGQVYGHVSVIGQSSLDSLAAALSKKAHAAGAVVVY